MDLIVNFTPTGMIPTKKMTPHVPIAPGEIVEDVHRAHEMGITMVHLHARDSKSGRPDYKAEIYADIISGIRRFSRELIVCVSLSGRLFQEFEKRAEALDLDGESKPDMGSLTLSSVNFNRQASVNEPEMIQALASRMQQRGIVPELEAFDTGMINYARYLEQKDLIRRPHYFNLILGNISCAQADMFHAGVMIKDLSSDDLWSLGGIGDWQLSMNTMAIAAGGGVRIGLEDNVWYDEQRTRLASNTDLLSRVHQISQAYGRTVMHPKELRRRLKLAPGNGAYGRVGKMVRNAA